MLDFAGSRHEESTFRNSGCLTEKENANLIDSFLQDMELRGLAPHTIETYQSSLNIFSTWLRADLRFAGRDELRKYLGSLRTAGLAHRTMAGRFTAMSSFYGFLEDEGIIERNPVPYVIKKYLRTYKKSSNGETRQLISVDQASELVNSILSTRDKAVVLLFLKTGMRVGEMKPLDLEDVDVDGLTLTLKPTAKRTNRTLFFDHETADCLEAWLRVRGDAPGGLFIGRGGRLKVSGIEDVVKKHAQRVGLHDPRSRRLPDRFTPHCCRHWFTHHLDEAGMKREYIQVLRGDVGKEAIDIYIHPNLKKIKESYLAHIPQLGI